MRGLASAALVIAALSTGCLPPRAGPLPGVPSPAPLPRAVLASGHQRVRFHWRYRDLDGAASGDGAARVAPPDSARLDFVLSGPIGGGGYALLLGDTLIAPGNGKGGPKRYLPATPLLWATLGRLAVPAGADTVVRVDGDTIRADIGDTSGVEGGGTTWRVTFTAGQMTTLAKLSGGRVRERVTRDLRQARVQYENMDARRSLTLTQVRSDTVPEFDPDVWQH
jgi:hypothetical protein